MEAFFARPGSRPLEVASWAPASLVQRLAGRGYTCRGSATSTSSLESATTLLHPAMSVREVTADTLDEWLAVIRAGQGFASPETAAISDEMPVPPTPCPA